MKYFIQDEVVHKYPMSRYCDVEYEEEELHDVPPKGYEKCEDCFGSVVGKSRGKSRRESRKDSWDDSEDEPW